jgi:ABC-type multidrug transport system fused ATPase/permease subunit
MKVAQKLWRILLPAQRRAVLVLLGLMLVGMVLETLGIGLVIPALALMSQTNFVTKYPRLLLLVRHLGNPSHEQLVIIGMLTLVAVYTIKVLFLGFLAWRQMTFVYGLQANVSQRLFIGYLRQPYTFHLQRNSAQLISNAVNETDQLTHSGLIAGMTVLTELLVILGISVLLIAIEPQGALLLVCTLGLAGWGFNQFTRTRILRWGEARVYHEGMRIQHLQQGLGGAKDVKLLGREEDFLSQYQFHNVNSARMGQYQKTLAQFPRLWLELLAIVGLTALVIVMITRGRPLDLLLPTVGLFAVAAFRLMPSVNRVLNGIQSLRFSLPVIDTIYDELSLLDRVEATPTSGSLSFTSVLTLDNVSFSYESAEAPALCGISLTVSCGTSVGFIGGSGAGKSTLVDIILGLLTPTTGTVKVDGIDIQRSLRAWQDRIGYVPQFIFLTDDTLRRNIAFGIPADRIDDAAIWRSLRAAQLEEFVTSLPLGLDTVVGERGVRLSGGQRQRIGIARALYHDPSVLVLDEATSALDTGTEKDVMEAVRALRGVGKTLLIVAHRLSTVEHCDRLYKLERGTQVEVNGVCETLHSE